MSSVWVWEESLFKKEDAPPAPMQISGLPDVSGIVAGRGALLALGADGSVWVWEVGRDTFSDAGEGFPAPRKIAELDDVTAIYSADGTNYAIKSDGTLCAWARPSRAPSRPRLAI